MQPTFYRKKIQQKLRAEEFSNWCCSIRFSWIGRWPIRRSSFNNDLGPRSKKKTKGYDDAFYGDTQFSQWNRCGRAVSTPPSPNLLWTLPTFQGEEGGGAMTPPVSQWARARRAGGVKCWVQGSGAGGAEDELRDTTPRLFPPPKLCGTMAPTHYFVFFLLLNQVFTSLQSKEGKSATYF